MLYSDLIFFLAFFPITAIISFLDSSAEYKNMILIISTLLFFSWGKPFAICLIFLSCFVDWGIGLAIAKNSDKWAKRILLMVDLAINLTIFLIFGHNYIFDEQSSLSLSTAIIPVGIGFYTIREFSYVYDVFKGNVAAEKNPLCLLTYGVNFQLLLAGPLVRYKDIEPQIRSRKVTPEKVNQGLNKMIFGLGKCVLLASVFERIKLAGLNGKEITTLGCWLGMAAFFAQYYFTFTGFADMGKGMGLISGFEYPDNYKIVDVQALFGGTVKSYNHTVTEFFGEVMQIREDSPKWWKIAGAVLCGSLLGLWYEAKLNYLLVGAAAGLLCGLEQAFLGKYLKKLPLAVKYIYICIVSIVIFGGLYFSSFYGYHKWLYGLLGVGVKYTLSVSVKYGVLKNITLIFIAFCGVCPFMKKYLKIVEEKLMKKCCAAVMALKTCFTAATLIMSLLTLAAQLVE